MYRLSATLLITSPLSSSSLLFSSIPSAAVTPPISLTSPAAGWLDGASHGANQINARVSSDGWGASPPTQHATVQRWNAAPLIIIHSSGLKGSDPSPSVALRRNFGGRSLSFSLVLFQLSLSAALTAPLCCRMSQTQKMGHVVSPFCPEKLFI